LREKNERGWTVRYIGGGRERIVMMGKSKVDEAWKSWKIGGMVEIERGKNW